MGAVEMPRLGRTPGEIVARWSTQGSLVRLATGIAPLDAACRGGLPVPWRVFLVGAPSAGKTFLAMGIANNFARAAEGGAFVGVLGVDEDPDDLTVRLAQLAGFTVAQAEERHPVTMQALQAELSQLQIRLYGSEQTIETAAADLAQAAAEAGRIPVLIIDSIQSVSSNAAAEGKTRDARATVEANVSAVRVVSDRHRMLVIATSEANRAHYRDNGQDQNPMAAGAESRAIEFGAQTQLVLSTPKGHPNVIHVRIAKNRRAQVGEFWLALDRESHSLVECEKPADDGTKAERSSAQTRTRKHAELEQVAHKLANALVRRQGSGLNSRDLRATAKAAGIHVADGTIDAARTLLASGVNGYQLSNRGTGARPIWFLETTAIHPHEDDHDPAQPN